MVWKMQSSCPPRPPTASPPTTHTCHFNASASIVCNSPHPTPPSTSSTPARKLQKDNRACPPPPPPLSLALFYMFSRSIMWAHHATWSRGRRRWAAAKRKHHRWMIHGSSHIQVCFYWSLHSNIYFLFHPLRFWQFIDSNKGDGFHTIAYPSLNYWRQRNHYFWHNSI